MASLCGCSNGARTSSGSSAGDRLDVWHVPGMLFIGDAAHTMSPVAGQGINLVIRDSIVTANHMLRARAEEKPWDSHMCQAIEDERRPESVCSLPEGDDFSDRSQPLSTICMPSHDSPSRSTSWPVS